MNLYPKSLEAVTKIILIMEEMSQASLNEDTGVLLGSTPLYSTDGHLIGAVNVDDDEHVYFTPSEDDYDEDGPEDGERNKFFQLDDPTHFAAVVEPTNPVVSLDEFRVGKVG